MNTKYMNPYLAGFLLGLVLLATIYITGHGLGASGALKAVVSSAVWSAAPNQVFARRLRRVGFTVDEIHVAARSSGKGRRHTIWLAGRAP